MEDRSPLEKIRLRMAAEGYRSLDEDTDGRTCFCFASLVIVQHHNV